MESRINHVSTHAETKCRYLGLGEDPATLLAFASPMNFCHRANPAEQVNLVHQSAYCLTRKHQQCPMLERSPGPLMPELALHGPGAGLPVSRWTIGAVLAVLVLLTALYGLFWRGGLASAPAGGPRVPASPTTALASPPAGVEGLIASPSPGLDVPATPALATEPALEANGGTPEAEPPTVTQAATVATEISCGAPPDWLAYTIRPNDTLFGLSLVLGVSVTELQQANCMGASTVLIAGQIFFVPFIPPVPATATPIPTQVEPTPPAESATPMPSATTVPSTPAPTGTIIPETESPTPPAPTATVPITPSPPDRTLEPTTSVDPGRPGLVG